MDDNNELNPLERDIVIKHLQENPVPVTVSLEDKPPAQETEMSGTSLSKLPSDNKISVATLFPVGIPVEQVSILDGGVIVINANVRAIKPFVNKLVRVQFYFNHLGLFFISPLVKSSKGFAVAIPSKIKKVSEQDMRINHLFTATILYNTSGNQTVQIKCLPAQDYDLRSVPKWQSIEPELQPAAQNLFERFVFSLSVKENNDVAYLINVCRYLTQRNEINAVEGKGVPLDVIFMNEKKIVLGSREQNPGLQLEADYNMRFSFRIGNSNLLQRTIVLACTVKDIYVQDEKRTRCFVLEIKNLQKEDNRFLYELFSGKRVL